ncbi:MAG: formyltetrahydrofolate deformylase [Bdellovibrionales bacterium]|nr:formyltetrahydrofolate deformylase [Bdellovibrionales bacterium]
MKANPYHDIARLLIRCPDRQGIVASVSNFLYNHRANITALDQHTTCLQEGAFFMRVEFKLPQLEATLPVLTDAFKETIVPKYDMEFRISHAGSLKRVALFVSKMDHALMELLWRWKRGELAMDIACVVSNHEDCKHAVESFGLQYFYIPVSNGNKVEAEREILQKLRGNVDFVILARYMQILSREFVQEYPYKIINIHHSFLPAFVGADPYTKAFERGVKLVGATAHFVTEDLDEGPIIEQDVARVNHRFSTDRLKELGRDIEKFVLARAVKWYLEDRIIVDGNKTIVFI